MEGAPRVHDVTTLAGHEVSKPYSLAPVLRGRVEHCPVSLRSHGHGLRQSRMDRLRPHRHLLSIAHGVPPASDPVQPATPALRGQGRVRAPPGRPLTEQHRRGEPAAGPAGWGRRRTCDTQQGQTRYCGLRRQQVEAAAPRRLKRGPDWRCQHGQSTVKRNGHVWRRTGRQAQ